MYNGVWMCTACACLLLAALAASAGAARVARAGRDRFADPVQTSIDTHGELLRSKVTGDPLVYPKIAAQDHQFLRVLSLDGGGVRGILTARVLAALEQHIQDLTGDPAASLADFVDVFAGTSTGGIMALALLTGKTAAEVSKLWMESAPYIFSSKMANFLGPAVEAGYKTDNLLEVMHREFPPGSMEQYADRSYAITSFDIGNYSSGVFTRNTNGLRGDFYPWQLGLATSAAPTYFPTAYITAINPPERSYTMIDGGIMANNPTAIALGVAEDDIRNFSFNNTVVLSVGAGIPTKTVNGQHDWGYTSWFFEGIFDLFLTGPQAGVDETMLDLFRQQPDQYARVQYKQKSALQPPIAPCEQADFAMDNVKPDNLQLLWECGNALADQNKATLVRMAKYFVARNAT